VAVYTVCMLMLSSCWLFSKIIVCHQNARWYV